MVGAFCISAPRAGC